MDLMRKGFLVAMVLFCWYPEANSQAQVYKLKLEITVQPGVKPAFHTTGRLFVFLSSDLNVEPRFSSGTNEHACIFASNITFWNPQKPLVVEDSREWQSNGCFNLQQVPEGQYQLQLVWDQDTTESRVNVPGNIISKALTASINRDTLLKLSLNEILPARKIMSHPLVTTFTMQSTALSAWWHKPVQLTVGVLLPSGYASHTSSIYTTRYNVAGYGGRYTRINDLLNNESLMQWWSSPEAPQIITVFLDGEGPFGDCYQVNSANNGPYGDALVKELIPALEKTFRMNPAQRFIDGCSTGGWVSLALQLFYPEIFQGCWSYSPDPVDFHHLQLINIYQDTSAFYYNQAYKVPSMRNTMGQPIFSIQQEVKSENVLGRSNTYVTSGMQWGAWNAAYSPRGADGLPLAIFHPTSGVIDPKVAEHWKNYDLLHYCRENWPTLGPKIAGKLNLWMGDMDEFYLNNALREFEKFIRTTTNPTSDAVIEFTPMAGHCDEYDHRSILEKMNRKIK